MIQGLFLLVSPAASSTKYADSSLLPLRFLVVLLTWADNIKRFERALNADLGRPSQEAILLELSPVITKAMIAYKKVSKWAAPDGVPFDINSFALKGKVLKDPQGVALIIGPFNYPIVCVPLRLYGR